MLLRNFKILTIPSCQTLSYLPSYLPVPCTLKPNINFSTMQRVNVIVICRLSLFNLSLEKLSQGVPVELGIGLWHVFTLDNYHFCPKQPLTLPIAVNLQSILYDTLLNLLLHMYILNGCPTTLNQ